jgi:hypothetical protein
MLRFYAFVFCLAISWGTASAQVDAIGPERPWLVFNVAPEPSTDAAMYANRLISAWDGLPEPLRLISTLQMHTLHEPGIDPVDWYTQTLTALQESPVPVVLTVTDAHTAQALSLKSLPALLNDAATVKGLFVGGLDFNQFPDNPLGDGWGIPPEAGWLQSVITIAGQHQKKILVELDDVQWLRVMSNDWCKPLYDTIQYHADQVIPLNGQNSRHAIPQQSALMGLRTEGTVAHWGVTVGSSWYNAYGFIQPGLFAAPNTPATMPQSAYRASILTGAVAGATVYRFEDTDDLWIGPQRIYWDNVIFSTLTEIISKGYITRQDLVERKTHVAYRLNPATSPAEFQHNLSDLDPLYNLGLMMRGLYGVEAAGLVPERIPGTGRYFWVPILSPYASEQTLRKFEEVMLPGALLDAQSWKPRLDPYYAPDGTGSAFISKVGRAIYVLHTRENLYEEQTFNIPEVPAPVRNVSLERQGTTVKISWPFREGDFSYRVFRVMNPSADGIKASEFVEIHSGLDSRSYIDDGIQPSDTVAYAVTALTNERETYSGSINYGDYRIISAVESRIDSGAIVRPYTVNGELLNLQIDRNDPRPKYQDWWNNLQQGAGNTAPIGQAIAKQLVALADAFHREDLETVASIYAPNYRDVDGMDKNYARKIYQVFFETHQAGPVHRQIREWDFNDAEFAGEIHVKVYWQFTGTDVNANNGTSDRLIQFPNENNGEIRLSFAQGEGGLWQIVRSEPALPYVLNLVN